MIYSHLPGPPQIIDFPLGGKGYKYLVADPERKRVVVMENGTENRRQGFRELAEMNETNLYMLPHSSKSTPASVGRGGGCMTQKINP